MEQTRRGTQSKRGPGPGTPTEPLYTFVKRSDETVYASLSTFRGRRYLDLRVYRLNDEGHLVPTRKGLTLAVDLLSELEAAVAALKQAADGEEVAP